MEQLRKMYAKFGQDPDKRWMNFSHFVLAPVAIAIGALLARFV